MSIVFDVTLVLNSLGGELYNNIPDNVKIRKMYSYSNFFQYLINEKRILNKVKILYKFLKLKFNKSYDKECRLLTTIYPKIDYTFDIAIAYSTPISLSNYYVIYNVNAKKKIMFIHNDMSMISLSPFESKELFQYFDNFVAVSKHAKKIFNKYYPKYIDKTIVFNNLVDAQKIIEMSKEKVLYKDNKQLHICTVGRLENEKGQDIIPYVINNLKIKKIQVFWHLIGSGSMEANIKTIAEDLNVINNIIFEGSQSNPYKFIKNCDIYVQTSRQEGYGITLLEAKILKKIIVSTECPCAYEHIVNKVNGLIVKFDSKEISNAIEQIIKNKNIKEKLTTNIAKFNYSENMSVIINMFNNE